MKVYLKFKRNNKTEIITEESTEFKIYKEKIENGYRIKGVFSPNIPITFKESYISLDYKINDNDIISANGYQSWTETSEYNALDTQYDTNHFFHFINKYIVDTGGDRKIHKLKEKKGMISSHKYIYLRNEDNTNYRLFGSLNSENCFTIFESDYNAQEMRIYADFKDTTITTDKTLFDFVYLEGTRDYVFDKFFELMKIYPITDKKIKGFTSWYNYYTNINEEIILKNVENFKKFKEEGNRVDIFQIDDGYQTFAGDWLDIIPEKFPNGLMPIADEINKNFMSGLWLAPFCVSPKSRLYKEHPDYILRNEKGKAPRVFYANERCFVLDIYNENVVRYLRRVFTTIFDKWHFKMIKLDFLYDAGVLPRLDKSRGEVMYDAVNLLRTLCSNHMILGCGVPLEACYGIFEYSRIGCDVSLDYEGDKVMSLVSKEAVSTKKAILDTVNRYVINNRALLNDPDVFFLRTNNISLTHNEKMLVAVTNAIFGSVLFTSDDFSLYEDEKIYEELKYIWHLNDSEILDYNIFDKDKIKVLISLDEKEYIYYLNASDNPWSIDDNTIEKRSYKYIES